MTPRRAAVAAACAGVLSLQYLVAVAYLDRGTWWHYLLHQMVGWGIGLAVAGLVAATTRYRVPAVIALVGGQLMSIVPDLQFRFQRMPHTASMDLWLGHISIHTGPSPVLVALGSVLLGATAYVGAELGRRRLAVVTALASGALVLVACLLAAPVPGTLAEFPTDTAPVSGQAAGSGRGAGTNASCRSRSSDCGPRARSSSSDSGTPWASSAIGVTAGRACVTVGAGLTDPPGGRSGPSSDRDGPTGGPRPDRVIRR